MLRRVALVRTDVSKELSASFIRVTRIGDLGTTLAVTSNLRTLQRFFQEPHGLTSQKTPFFIVTAVKASNLTNSALFVSFSFLFLLLVSWDLDNAVDIATDYGLEDIRVGVRISVSLRKFYSPCRPHWHAGRTNLPFNE
jgi:hypothetical protein